MVAVLVVYMSKLDVSVVSTTRKTRCNVRKLRQKRNLFFFFFAKLEYTAIFFKGYLN